MMNMLWLPNQSLIDRTMIRKSLLNGLMEFLEDNKHEELPQKIFEVGDVAYIDSNTETGTVIMKKIACASHIQMQTSQK